MSSITAAIKRKALEIITARFDEVKDSDEVKRAKRSTPMASHTATTTQTDGKIWQIDSIESRPNG